MDTQITFRSEQRLTQDEFFHWLGRLPDDDLHHYELIHGRIVMTPPAGFLHGTIEALVVQRLGNHVEQYELGTVLGSSAGYDLPSGDTLEPDVSFVLQRALGRGPALLTRALRPGRAGSRGRDSLAVEQIFRERVAGAGEC